MLAILLSFVSAKEISKSLKLMKLLLMKWEPRNLRHQTLDFQAIS